MSIYHVLEHLKLRPAMYLGNEWGINALNHFITGYTFGSKQKDFKSQDFPNFYLFTDWVASLLKYKYSKSPANWAWLISEKYKDDKIAFQMFFEYLEKFKHSRPKVWVVNISNKQIEYAIEHKAENYLNYLWCKVGNIASSYNNNLKRIDKIILFKLLPSKTLFSLLIDKNNKVIETRNSDISDSELRNDILIQFGINVNDEYLVSFEEGKDLLKHYKII